MTIYMITYIVYSFMHMLDYVCLYIYTYVQRIQPLVVAGDCLENDTYVPSSIQTCWFIFFDSICSVEVGQFEKLNANWKCLKSCE